MGMPNPAFSFARVLEVMLRAQYPDLRFEVINTAMTAINSHVALEIVKDCACHGPDLFVVYLGNNEVVGPYGPGTVFQRWLPGRGTVRAAIWVKSTRVGQWLTQLLERYGRTDTPTAWKGMEMFLGNWVAADDPRLPRVYENFRLNLMDMVRIARRAGAAVILSTVAVNLKDCPPLASRHRQDLSPQELAHWETLDRDGAASESQGDFQKAIELWEAAARIDDRYAELAFRIGRRLAAMGRYAEARSRFEQARDLDVLRFRADSQINATIRAVAEECKNEGVRLVDAEQVFADPTSDSGGIPGCGLFYEHVHLTFDGNYLLAKAVLEAISDFLAESVRSRPKGPPPSKTQCAEELALTPWDEFHMAEVMAEVISRPPFTNQLDHARREAAVRERVARLRLRALAPESLREAVKTYQAALAKRPDDWRLHDRFAHLAELCGRRDLAAAHWRMVVQQFPWLVDRRVQLGQVLLSCGDYDAAAGEFSKALESDPQNVEAHNGLAMALIVRGDLEPAIKHLQEALRLRPDYFEAEINLGMALSQQGRLDEAIARFSAAQRIEPLRPDSHINLANVLYRQGKMDAAIAHWREAVRLQPEGLEGLNQLASVLATCPIPSLRNAKEAVELAQRAAKLSGRQDPSILETLAAAHAEAGETAQAVAITEEAIALAVRRNQAALADALRAKLRLYKARLPTPTPPQAKPRDQSFGRKGTVPLSRTSPRKRDSPRERFQKTLFAKSPPVRLPSVMKDSNPASPRFA